MVQRKTADEISKIESDPTVEIKQFRGQISSNSKLSELKFDDKLLLKFLRSREFNHKRAFQVLEGYVSKLNERPDLFAWDPSFRQILELGLFNYYFDTTVEGRQVFFFHPGRWDPKEVKIEILIRLVILCQEIVMLDEKVQRAGVVIIIDMTGLSLNHLYQCGVFNAKLISDITDKCIPMNIINIHIVFQNWLTEMAYNLFKPFLDEELKRRLVFHGYNTGKLHEYCSRSILPEKYGGSHDEADPEELFQHLAKTKHVVEEIWSKYKPHHELNGNKSLNDV